MKTVQGILHRRPADARRRVGTLGSWRYSERSGEAWCATKRAIDGLFLARTGKEPGANAYTSNELDTLAREDRNVKVLVCRY